MLTLCWHYADPMRIACTACTTHRGLIKMKDSLVNGTGDDCFNVHGNFIILANIAGKHACQCIRVSSFLGAWKACHYSSPLFLGGVESMPLFESSLFWRLQRCRSVRTVHYARVHADPC